MVITGEYVVKGLFHHYVVKGGLFHPVHHIFFFFCTTPTLFRADVIEMHGCTYIHEPTKSHP